MDKFQEMASFVAVVDAGSFVGAADAVGLSKAAVSRHVAELEQRLGARLLHRTTRRLSLTDDGQLFYARAKEMLAAVDEAESEISSRSGEPSGRLRINAPLSFGVLHLAPLWPRFAQLYPKVSLDIELSDRVVDLVEEGYDLAIRITNLPNSQLVSRQLATTRMIACASPPYLAQHGTPAHPDELAQHEVISYSYFAARDEWTFTAPNDTPVVVHTHARIHANNGDTCRAAALEHQGIILQPDFIVADDLHRGTLIELLPTWRTMTLGIHAVYPSRKHLPIKTRRLVDFLVEAFAAPEWDVAR
ncbi:MAG TPA: LysR family transcriptional regulator [Rhodanobacter sp.]|nr:LysR family transcriptional regulator [Rhodanobacter sp.]